MKTILEEAIRNKEIGDNRKSFAYFLNCLVQDGEIKVFSDGNNEDIQRINLSQDGDFCYVEDIATGKRYKLIRTSSCPTAYALISFCVMDGRRAVELVHSPAYNGPDFIFAHCIEREEELINDRLISGAINFFRD